MPEEVDTRPTPSPAMREERKVVTALFADLVGSTALTERIDPEEVKLIVGEAVARMVHAVEEFGGTVKDLAGDGLLALFGAPNTHEDDAERGVRAGLRIVLAIRAYADEVASGWGVEGFGVRVGVATGPVVLGPVGAGQRVEYGAFGDTVNTAARLSLLQSPEASWPRAIPTDLSSHCSSGAHPRNWSSRVSLPPSGPTRSSGRGHRRRGPGGSTGSRHRWWGEAASWPLPRPRSRMCSPAREASC